MYSKQEFDKYKTKVIKYITYKKRTEQEVLNKFKGTIQDNILKDIVEYLKEINYINDEDYIEKAINEFINIYNLSMKELKYKLLAKGLNKELIEEYVDKQKNQLTEYEKQSVKKIVLKKSSSLNKDELKLYLIKKGYILENILEALELYNN